MHLLITEDNVTDQSVTTNTDQKDESIKTVKENLKSGSVFKIIIAHRPFHGLIKVKMETYVIGQSVIP